MSETNTPASTSTFATATKEKKVPTEEGLARSETAIKILEKEEITGSAFLEMTEEKFRSLGMPAGPASDLADFAKELGKHKLKSFSFYKPRKT
ncbi:6136_t:CDS:2 [Paraglomus brasilianum]|uniref:6136_t:CDS:1 n=1 Tax=Paraglomus brasilianum TaxID=144538 RepID=A0A9N9H6S9_9GLOM|nr:6136_t:CDS:2 [Paraglomus brasilianum]